MARETSRIVLAIAALQSEVGAGQIASQETLDPPQGVTVTVTSTEIIAGNGPRLVVISNLGIQDVFLSIDQDAIAEAGITLFQNDSKLIPLGDGRGLHAITQMATSKLAWQSFG